jgi:hypothetical protein
MNVCLVTPQHKSNTSILFEGFPRKNFLGEKDRVLSFLWSVSFFFHKLPLTLHSVSLFGISVPHSVSLKKTSSSNANIEVRERKTKHEGNKSSLIFPLISFSFCRFSRKKRDEIPWIEFNLLIERHSNSSLFQAPQVPSLHEMTRET